MSGIKDEGNGNAIVGISDFAQTQLGDIVFIEIETHGETLQRRGIYGYH